MTFVQKTRAFNVDVIDGSSQFHQHLTKKISNTNFEHRESSNILMLKKADRTMLIKLTLGVPKSICLFI